MKSQKQIFKESLVLSISLLTLLSSTLPSQAAAVDDACTAYNQHNYSDALKKLDSLPTAQRGAKASYYRGLTLQALHRYGEAIAEYRKVATQRNDLRLAAMARQGMVGLARMPKQQAFHESSSPRVSSTSSSNGSSQKIVEGGNWKVVEAGYGAQGENKHGMPETWTYIKTSNGCGRH